MPNRLAAALPLVSWATWTRAAIIAAVAALWIAGGIAPTRAATMAGLQPDFRARLSALLHALPGVTITSGYRSVGQQAALYWRATGHGRHGTMMVAAPGRSMHNLGLAADLHFAGYGSRAAAHRMAGAYGLTFPMGWEPWHVEPAGARALAYAPISPLAAAAAAVPWPISLSPHGGRGHVVHLVTYRHHHHRHARHRRHWGRA